MNQELNSAIAEILKSSKDGVVAASSFIQAQAPELAREIVQWGIFGNILGLIFSIIGVFISLKIIKKANKITEEDIPELFVPLYFIGYLIMLVVMIVILSCSFEIVKCLVSPKLFVLDYVRGLIK